MSIVNPMVFYWLNTLGGVKVFILVTAGIAATIFLVCACVAIGEEADSFFKEKAAQARSQRIKFSKLFGIALVVMFIGLLIPSRETMYQMAIAKYATYENVEAAGNVVKSVFDYIVESAKLLMESK